MRDYVMQVVRGLVRILLFPLRLLGRGVKKGWRGLGLLGLGLRRLLSRALRGLWGLLGRMGLALRRILNLIFWQPLLFVTSPWRWFYGEFLRQPTHWVGRHLALLLTLLIISPLRWLVRSVVRLLVAIFVRPVQRAVGFLRQKIGQRWAAGANKRLLRRRRWHSRWLIWHARLLVLWHQPRAPRHSAVAPVIPRPAPPRRSRRLVTTAATAGLLIVASLITVRQAPQLNRAVAEDGYTLNPDKLPVVAATEEQPTPTPTPIPPTPWPTPDPLDGGGSVIFTLRQNGNSDLYALSIGQSQPVRLTNHPAADRDPAWSPDGREVAFASQRDGNWEIYILNLQSGEQRRLTDDPAFDGGPAWSPDGQWLVFESYRNQNLDLYIMRTDGSQGPIRLTEHPAPDFAPVWSPGGRHIAFTSWRSGNKDIFIMSLDAASDATAVNVTNTPDGFEDDAAFSPSGDRLAYYDDSTGFELVYALPLVEYAPAGPSVAAGQGRHPSWSPDGEALVYVHTGEAQSHLIAGTLDAWSVAPQAFTAAGRLDSPMWTARTLPLELPEHLRVVNDYVDLPLFTEGVQPRPEDGAPYLLLQMPVDAPAPYLSDRVDQSFLALRDHVLIAAGWDFLQRLDDMYHVPEAQPLPGLSDLTWNKAGRAFDYDARSLLSFEPQVEVMREQQGSELYWRTYLRTTQQDGTMGEPLRDLPWDFRARYGAESQYYDKGGKWREQIPAGYYIDFTELAADYSWNRVPAADNWRTYFPAINFWHYENRQSLTWEEAMLELFTSEQLNSFLDR